VSDNLLFDSKEVGCSFEVQDPVRSCLQEADLVCATWGGEGDVGSMRQQAAGGSLRSGSATPKAQVEMPLLARGQL
jgi:hypothetical protein